MGIKGMGMGGIGFGNEVTEVVWIALESESVNKMKLFGLLWNGNGNEIIIFWLKLKISIKKLLNIIFKINLFVLINNNN